MGERILQLYDSYIVTNKLNNLIAEIKFSYEVINK